MVRSNPLNPTGVMAGWKAQPIALRILRAFLGVTFVYAGIQKMLDPNFLHAGSVDYIGAQLADFSRGSPLAPALHFARLFPIETGVAVAVLEIAIGVGTLLGVAPMASAAAGFTVNLALTLSASWHIHPYFLGSDSIYAVAWLAYGTGLWEMNRRRRQAVTSKKKTARVPEPALGRREFLRGGLVAGIAVAVAGAAKLFAGSPSSGSSLSSPSAPAPPARASGSAVPTQQGPPAPVQPAQPPPGTTIANLDSLKVGDATAFSDPGLGPCALVRLTDTKCAAYSRLCTHAGCEVGYNPSTRLLVCPCHGAEFDPSRGGRPVAGPTNIPLQEVSVVVDRHTGDVILPQ